VVVVVVVVVVIVVVQDNHGRAIKNHVLRLVRREQVARNAAE
jgi:hypothetical protein